MHGAISGTTRMQLPLPIDQLSRPLKLRDSDRRNRNGTAIHNPHRFPIEMANICRDKCLPLKCGNYKTNVRKSIPHSSCFFTTFANTIRTQVCAHFAPIVRGCALKGAIDFGVLGIESPLINPRGRDFIAQ